jgi:Kdo2-lipid IVA lauroyltransferase/acyltransferase
MRSSGKRLRYKLEWLGVLLASKVVPILPRSVCLFFGWLCGLLGPVFDREGRRVALENLELAFGHDLSRRQRYRIMRQSFRHFGQTMIDLLWSARLTRENFRDYIELENFEEAEPFTHPGQPVIVVTYHYSNFEWFSFACAYSGMTALIISQEFKNSLLDPIFKTLRERAGHEMIQRERGIIRLYKALRRKGRAALLVDLTVPPREGAVAIDCFGLKTSVTSAHAWLQQQTGAPILPAHCEPLPHGRYRMVYHPKIENTGNMTLQQITQACWNSFESYMRRNPAPWLWMYKHWRYKPRQPDRPYPYYAQSWKAFERILAAGESESRDSIAVKSIGDQ